MCQERRWHPQIAKADYITRGWLALAKAAYLGEVKALKFISVSFRQIPKFPWNLNDRDNLLSFIKLKPSCLLILVHFYFFFAPGFFSHIFSWGRLNVICCDEKSSPYDKRIETDCHFISIGQDSAAAWRRMDRGERTEQNISKKILEEREQLGPKKRCVLWL